MREEFLVPQSGGIYLIFQKKTELQFQWFLYLVSYLKFIMNNMINIEMSQNSEIHEAMVRSTTEQFTVIASSRTYIPLMLSCPK